MSFWRDDLQSVLSMDTGVWDVIYTRRMTTQLSTTSASDFHHVTLEGRYINQCLVARVM